MQQKTVSIIIPIYNSETYLCDCIESTLKQGLSNYEVLLIDDGSTDRSGQIAHQYAEQYHQITYYYQENNGVSVARNQGIEKAQGQYVYFLDSDDYLVDNALGSLYQKASADQLDMLLFDARPFSEQQDFSINNTPAYEREFSYGQFDTGEDLMSRMIEGGDFTVSPCLYLTKKQVLEEHHLRFTEGVYFEDEIYSVELLLIAKRSAHINHKYYMRRYRPNSIMTGSSVLRRFISYQHVLNCFDFIYRSHPFLSKQNQHAVRIKLRDRYMSVLRLYHLLENKAQYETLYREAIDIGKQYNYFDWKGKLATFCYPLYYSIITIRDVLNGRYRK